MYWHEKGKVGKRSGLLLWTPWIVSRLRLFACVFLENMIWKKKRLVKIDFRPSPTYNMLKMNIGSFHGFGKHINLFIVFSGQNSAFRYFPIFGFWLVKVWVLLKSIPYQIPYWIPNQIPYQIAYYTKCWSKPILCLNPIFFSHTQVSVSKPSSRNWSLVVGMEDIPPIHALQDFPKV